LLIRGQNQVNKQRISGLPSSTSAPRKRSIRWSPTKSSRGDEESGMSGANSARSINASGLGQAFQKQHKTDNQRRRIYAVTRLLFPTSPPLLANEESLVIMVTLIVPPMRIRNSRVPLDERRKWINWFIATIKTSSISRFAEKEGEGPNRDFSGGNRV